LRRPADGGAEVIQQGGCAAKAAKGQKTQSRANRKVGAALLRHLGAPQLRPRANGALLLFLLPAQADISLWQSAQICYIKHLF
jgi:hypothetical protein